MSDTFRPLIDRVGLSEFAKIIGVAKNTAKQMRRRDSVAPEYWPPLVAGFQARGFSDVSTDRLAEIAQRQAVKKRQQSSHEQATAA